MFISPKTQSTGDVLINKLPKPTFLTKSTRPNLSWTLMMILLWQHDDRCFHVFNLFLNGTSDGFISVGIIIMGAFIAGAQDLSFDSNGYAFVFLANICTAVYLASVARVGIFLFFFVLFIPCEASRLILFDEDSCFLMFCFKSIFLTLFF